MKNLVIFVIESILLFIYLIGILLLLDNPKLYIMWVITPWAFLLLFNIKHICKILKKLNS